MPWNGAFAPTLAAWSSHNATARMPARWLCVPCFISCSSVTLVGVSRCRRDTKKAQEVAPGLAWVGSRAGSTRGSDTHSRQAVDRHRERFAPAGRGRQVLM